MPGLPVPALADDVVRLRPWREADVAAQLAAFSDPFFLRFSDWAPRTESEALAYLAAHEQARRRGEQIELALVEPHDESVVLGGGSLNNVDLPEARAAIGPASCARRSERRDERLDEGDGVVHQLAQRLRCRRCRPSSVPPRAARR